MRLITAALLVLSFPAQAIDILTSEYNQNRTGHNPNETVLTPTNVAAGTFGKLGTYPVDGVVYGRLLFLDNYNVGGGVLKNLMFACTMANTLYAFDLNATPGPGAILWQTHWNAPLDIQATPTGSTHGHSQFLAYTAGCPETPVIDRAAGIIYSIASDGTAGSTTTGWRIHRNNLATGAEIGSPTQVNAKFAGAGDQFSSTVDTQDGSGNFLFNGHYEYPRIPLALAGGVLYSAWSAYGDIRPGHGYIIGHRVSDMAQVSQWTCSPSPTSAGGSGLCSLWQSGRGLPVDPSGNLYTMTGNGGFDGTANFGDVWAKLSPSLSLTDWYSPNNNAQINAGDWDISSSGPVLVPGTNWLVGGAKDRVVRVINTANMGHLDPANGTSPTITTAINACNTACNTFQTSGIYNQAYSPLNTMFYESDVAGPLYGLPFNESTGVLSSPSIQTAESFAFPGAFVSVSYASGVTGTGIVWASVTSGATATSSTFSTASNAFITHRPGRLVALNALTLATLWDSDVQKARDSVGTLAKFQPPVVNNGRMYQPANSGQIHVYGLGASAVAAPTRTVVGYR